MPKVLMEMSVSLDGYATCPDVSPEEPMGRGGEQLHAWMSEGRSGTEVEAYENEHFSGIGDVIVGRRMADLGIVQWGDEPTFHAPVFVKKGGTSSSSSQQVSSRLFGWPVRPSWSRPPQKEEAMAQERAPEHARSLVPDESGTTSWKMARERLANPEIPRTCWLATTRPDGRPHLVPVIGFWIDGAMHVVAGEGTRKARNLAANSQCVIATSSTTLPSFDVVIEGTAEPLTHEAVTHVAEFLNSNNWPLEVEGDKVRGPHAPTAGPPPYTIFRIVPSKVFGLPGMLGMEQFDQSELPKPTRWDFSRPEPLRGG